MSYTCNGNGSCNQERLDECRYHDELVRPFVDGTIDLAFMFRDRAVRIAGDNFSEGTALEVAYWRELEKTLEEIGSRLQKVRRERDELLAACERLLRDHGNEQWRRDAAEAVARAHGRSTNFVKLEVAT